jgi:hypothetical protein
MSVRLRSSMAYVASRTVECSAAMVITVMMLLVDGGAGPHVSLQSHFFGCLDVSEQSRLKFRCLGLAAGPSSGHRVR